MGDEPTGGSSTSNPVIIGSTLWPTPLRIAFFAYHAYQVKDVLKANGWRWDSLDRMWGTEDMDAFAAALDDLLASGEVIDFDALGDYAIAALPEKTRERVSDRLSSARAKRIRDEMGGQLYKRIRDEMGRRMTNAREPSGDCDETREWRDAGAASEEAAQGYDAGLTPAEAKRQLDAELAQNEVRPSQRSPRRR